MLTVCCVLHEIANADDISYALRRQVHLEHGSIEMHAPPERHQPAFCHPIVEHLHDQGFAASD